MKKIFWTCIYYFIAMPAEGIWFVLTNGEKSYPKFLKRLEEEALKVLIPASSPYIPLFKAIDGIEQGKLVSYTIEFENNDTCESFKYKPGDLTPTRTFMDWDKGEQV